MLGVRAMGRKKNKGKGRLVELLSRRLDRAKETVPPAGVSERKKKLQRLSDWRKRLNTAVSTAAFLNNDTASCSGSSYRTAHEIDHTPLITGPDTSLGNCIAMDCEFVGTGLKGCVSMLGRCSIVNHHGHILYDTYVKPLAPVTDYRTLWSGIRKKDLVGAPDFNDVQSRIKDFLRGRILVGHDLRHDMRVLDLKHPRSQTRDTAMHTFNPFSKMSKGVFSKLRTQLRNVRSDVDIQHGEHSSVEDAQAAMLLYQSAKDTWERSSSSSN